MLPLIVALLLLIPANPLVRPCELIKVHRHKPRVCSHGHCEKCKTGECARCQRKKPKADRIVGS